MQLELNIPIQEVNEKGENSTDQGKPPAVVEVGRAVSLSFRVLISRLLKFVSALCTMATAAWVRADRRLSCRAGGRLCLSRFLAGRSPFRTERSGRTSQAFFHSDAGSSRNKAEVDRAQLGFATLAVTSRVQPPAQPPLVAPIYASSVFCPKDAQEANATIRGVSWPLSS